MSQSPPPRICIIIFTCATAPRFRREIAYIQKTWGRRAKLSGGIRLLFCCGARPATGDEIVAADHEEFVYFPEAAADDYHSATPKQNLGIKYAWDHYNPDYYWICGSDTWIHVENLLDFLEKNVRDPSNDRVFLGGEGATHYIGHECVEFLSGGPVIVLSRASVATIHHRLHTMEEDWTYLMQCTNRMDLNNACDVALAFFLRHDGGITINRRNDLFLHWSYDRFSHIDPRKHISFHDMLYPHMCNIYKICYGDEDTELLPEPGETNFIIEECTKPPISNT